jgi:GT2 family glycosyltransferase
MLPDSLLRLLKHFDDPAIEVVAGLSFARQWPDKALWIQDGEMMTTLPPPGALEPLEASTFGGMLIRLSAIAKIERPYVTLGDDREFCAKLRAAGVKVWGDSSVRFGHTTDMEIWPHWDEANGWTVVYARNLEPKAIQSWGQPALQEA